MANKRKTRMYEPWGYQDENNYKSTEIIVENDFDAFLVDTSYNKDDNKIYFTNKDGEVKASLDVNEFVKSDSIIEKTEYKDGILKIYFTNGDVVTIDLTELVDENEFKDGLIVDGHIVKVLINSESDDYISVDGNGVKLAGVKADIEAEEARAASAETALDEKIDAEIARARDVETQLQAAIEAEGQRAQDAESALNTAISNEVTRAEAAEAALSRRNDMLNDELDGEKTIREAADVALGRRIDQEIDDRIADVDEEEARAKTAEQALQEAIDAETQRATEAEEALNAKIDDAVSALTDAIAAEEGRAEEAEQELENSKFDDVVYDSSAKTINFIADGSIVKGLDATPFIKDGMIDDVKIEGGNLVIIFNTDSGKETITIPLTEIFDPSNYYTKAEVDGFIGDLQGAIEAEEARAISAETDLDSAIALKADADTVYTQEEVNALLLAKENEIYNLTKIVGDIGGAVTYEYPNEAGKSLTTLLGNNGTVKMTDDATISRFGPGITANNNVKLNLNNHNLTATSAGSYGAIMSRGTQVITIGGKGTIDAGNGICIEGNGADSVINLTGSTTVYQNDRSGGELIYCYAGTINITNGTFKNNGEDKKYLLNCYDANYSAGTAKIIVTGGKFYDFNPGNNTAEGPDTSFLAEGYHTEASTVVEEGVEHTVYTVKKD